MLVGESRPLTQVGMGAPLVEKLDNNALGSCLSQATHIKPHVPLLEPG